MIGKIARALLPGQSPGFTYRQGEAATLAVDGDGNVWVRQASGTTTVVEGDTAHDDSDQGNPVKIGGRAQGSPSQVADGDRVDASFDRSGRLRVSMDQVNIENANLEVHLEATNVEAGQVPDSVIGFGTEDGTISGTEHALRVDSQGRLITTQAGNAGDSFYSNHTLAGSDTVKASSGTLWEISGVNADQNALFIQLWDGQVGQATLLASYRVPPNENYEKQFPRGLDFGTDIRVNTSTARTSVSNPSTGASVYAQYQ